MDEEKREFESIVLSSGKIFLGNELWEVEYRRETELKNNTVTLVLRLRCREHRLGIVHRFDPLELNMSALGPEEFFTEMLKTVLFKCATHTFGKFAHEVFHELSGRIKQLASNMYKESLGGEQK